MQTETDPRQMQIRSNDRLPDAGPALDRAVTVPERQMVAPRASGSVTPHDLLRHAMSSGADLDRLEKLMDLADRHEANEARKAFADDMARFKAKPLEIGKDKHVNYKNKDGGFTSYWHATIGNVVDVIVPALAEFGFSHRWDLEQRDGQVIVTCVVTHRMGHSQSTMLQASPDASGGKNGIQSIISAKTYLERHTLLAATGLATKDQEDDDGAAGGAKAEMQSMAADMRKNEGKTIKHKIDQPTLKRALAAIKAGDYTYPELVDYYDLTPEQLAHARTESGVES